MNRLIADKPDLIISVPASASAIVPSYIRAKRAGIPILGAIGRQSAEGAKLVTAEARTDDPALGRFAAMNLVEGMRKAGYKTGNVIALTGTASQNNVTDRMAAFKAHMKKFPQYKIVAIQDTNWDQATSAKVAQQLLSKYASQGGIQGAYGMADNMAVGIIQGARQAGVRVGVAKKGLIVTGSNCLRVGINAIRSGLEYGTGTQAPQVEAALAVKLGDADPERPHAEPEGAVRPRAAHHGGERREVHEALHVLARVAARFDERRPGSGGLRPDPDLRPLTLRPGASCSRSRASRSRTARCGRCRSLTLDVRVGEVHAICGHNGAGKSTLVKSLVGLVRPDAGVMRFDGVELAPRNPHEAQAHGIALVNQELSLVPELSVEDNIFLGGIGVPLLYRRRRLSDHARRGPRRARPRPRPARDRRRVPLDRRAAARRDRAAARPRRTPADPRRADRDPQQAGDRAGVPGDARPRRAGAKRDLRLPPARRGLRAVRSRDGACATAMRVATHAVHEIDRRSLIEHMLGEMEGAKTQAEHEHALPGSGDRGRQDRPAPRPRQRRGAVARARERRSSRDSPVRSDPARARCSARSAGSSRTPRARSRCTAGGCSSTRRGAPPTRASSTSPTTASARACSSGSRSSAT